MKQIVSILFIFLFIVSGCEPTDSGSSNTTDTADSGYTLSSDGKIATVSTSAGLKEMLAKDGVTEITLKSGNYTEEYEINDAKEVIGSSETSINKISVNSTGAKISSPKITSLLAGKGIGDGDLTLENVTIEGDAVFQGGGSNSIKVKGNSKFEGNVTLDKEGLSFKLESTIQIKKSIVVSKPANLLPIDENSTPPNIAASIAINYDSTQFTKVTLMNIGTSSKLIVGEGVTGMSLGTQANDTGSIVGAGADAIAQTVTKVEMVLTTELTAIIALMKLNAGLITGANPDNITGNFTLVSTVTVDSSIPALDIKWTSSNPEIIALNGTQATVTRPAVNTTVTLTAEITVGAITVSKGITVIVSGASVVTYTVTFNSNEGSTVNAQIVVSGGLVTKPGNPAKAGFTFNGWYKESTYVTSWDFTKDTVTSNITLYAGWTDNAVTPVTYTVTFKANDGSTDTVQVVNDGELATEPTAPVKAGYTFGGWYKETGLTTAWVFSTEKVTANVELYAKWTINNYTVTFNSNGGSTVTSMNADYNTKVSAPPATPTQSGYTFAGWFKETDLTTKWDFLVDTVTSNITLYAGWTADGVTGTITATIVIGAADPVTLPGDISLSTFETFNVAVSETTYTAYEWYIDGKKLLDINSAPVTGHTIFVSLQPLGLEPGIHELTCVVTNSTEVKSSGSVRFSITN